MRAAWRPWEDPVYEEKSPKTNTKPSIPEAKAPSKGKDRSKLKGMTFNEGAAALAPKDGPSKVSGVTSAQAVVTEIRLYEEDMGEIYGHVIVTQDGKKETVPFFIDRCWGAEFDKPAALAKYPAAIQASELKGFRLSKAAEAELSAGFVKEILHKANSVDWNSPKFKHKEYASYSF